MERRSGGRGDEGEGEGGRILIKKDSGTERRMPCIVYRELICGCCMKLGSKGGRFDAKVGLILI